MEETGFEEREIDLEDIYSEEGVECQGEDDLISVEEEGFMMGYMSAGIKTAGGEKDVRHDVQAEGLLGLEPVRGEIPGEDEMD